MAPLLAPMTLAAAVPADTLVLPPAAPFVAVTVNGAPMRLRVAFDAPLPVTLRPEAAARAHLRSVGRSTVLVGPVALTGGVAEAQLALGTARRRARVIWMTAAPTDDAGIDGLVSPAALPVATVRLGRAEPGRRTGALAARVDPASGILARIEPAGRPIDLLLAPQRAESIATASAGAALADALGGTVENDAPAARILFGIDRPVRWLRLDRPLHVAGLSLARLLVRTRDFPGATPVEAAAPESPDEIVVTGGRPAVARLRLSLGADVLGRCDAISWQAATSRLILECP